MNILIKKNIILVSALLVILISIGGNIFQQNQIKELQTKITNCYDEKDDLETKIKNLQDELDQCQSQKDSYKSQTYYQNDNNSSLESDKDDLERKVRQLEDELDDCEGKLRDCK